VVAALPDFEPKYSPFNIITPAAGYTSPNGYADEDSTPSAIDPDVT